MGRLEGKVALVSGAGGGIGSAMCRSFLAEGARVVATDIDAIAAEDAVRDARPGAALPLRVDAVSGEEVRESVTRAVGTFGRLDVLCHAAGGSSLQDGPVTEAPEEEFWRVIRLDLYGTWLACRHAIPEIIRSGGGSVINLTSMTAILGTIGRDGYTAAKGGVASITRSMAAEYAADGVRVNAIAPGITLTPRVRARLGPGSSIGDLAARHLLGLVEPEDVAQMALYLASDESARITGQIFQVDSGVTIH